MGRTETHWQGGLVGTMNHDRLREHVVVLHIQHERIQVW